MIGLISDTHGLLRPQAVEALRGAERIIHAGDIGTPDILQSLEAIAPTTAIRGNVDKDVWARALPETAVIEASGIAIYVIHDVKQLTLDPARAGFTAVVSGHSHKPGQQARGGVLYVNPGSAGPRRFRLPVTVARLYVETGRLRAEIVELDVTSS